MKKHHRNLSALASLAFVLVACTPARGTVEPRPAQVAEGPSATAATSTPAPGGVSSGEIVIGMSAAFTGPSRGLGIELYRGSMAYLEGINRAGGINGRTVAVRAYDDGYEPIPAIRNTIRLIEDDQVFLLFDYVGTPTVTRVLPLLRQSGDDHIFLFFPFTGAQPQREPPYDAYVLNLRASYRQETEGLVERFLELGRNRIAVFYQADAYGRSGWDGVTRALAARHLKVVAEATYRRGAAYSESFGEQVDILRAAEPDAIISIGAYEACAGFIRDARDAGWDVPIANVSFVGSENMLDLLLAAGRKTGKSYTANLMNSQVVPSYENTALAAVSEYREAMDRSSPMPPAELLDSGYEPFKDSFAGFEGFLNAKLLVEILKRMGGSPDRARIMEVAESIKDFDLGVGAPVSFGPDRHQGLDSVYYTTVEGDRWVPVVDWRQWAK
jgi:ABC-type branched-subunit amino acid transport system substrate-binding protein